MHKVTITLSDERRKWLAEKFERWDIQLDDPRVGEIIVGAATFLWRLQSLIADKKGGQKRKYVYAGYAYEPGKPPFTDAFATDNEAEARKLAGDLGD